MLILYVTTYHFKRGVTSNWLPHLHPFTTIRGRLEKSKNPLQMPISRSRIRSKMLCISGQCHSSALKLTTSSFCCCFLLIFSNLIRLFFIWPGLLCFSDHSFPDSLSLATTSPNWAIFSEAPWLPARRAALPGADHRGSTPAGSARAPLARPGPGASGALGTQLWALEMCAAPWTWKSWWT